MKIFITSLYKEFLVLIRDRSALAILFIMPLILVIVMALLQDGPYKSFQKTQFPLILVDNDKDTVSDVITNSISASKVFTVYDSIDGAPATVDGAKKAVAKGKFKAGIVIPSGLSDYLRKKARLIVIETFSKQIIPESKLYTSPPDSLKIKTFFDPLALSSLKNTVASVLEKTVSRLVSQTIVDAYYKQLETYYPIKNKIQFENCNIIEIKEIPLDSFSSNIVLNSVQHNVPAWAIFAVFFIFLPLAGGIIKERDDGTFMRLKIMPDSFMTLINGKIVLYTMVGCVQFLLMLIVGLYFLPLIGLPSLIIGNSFSSVIIIVFSASLAATGFGVMIGTFFSTHQQVVTFGSISVIILAALGGIWVPVYIMSKTMVNVSKFSPLEWGLHAFNEIFLYNGSFYNIYMDALKLISFSIISFILSYMYYKYRSIK